MTVTNYSIVYTTVHSATAVPYLYQRRPINHCTGGDSKSRTLHFRVDSVTQKSIEIHSQLEFRVLGREVQMRVLKKMSFSDPRNFSISLL